MTTQSPSEQSRQISLGSPIEEIFAQLGWKQGYLHKRPATSLRNMQSSTRHISDAYMGVFPGSQLQADILTVTESDNFQRKTRVLRILTPRQFPRIALNRFANDTVINDAEDDLVSLPSTYKLEGDFHSFFDIRYVRGTEREALVVLTPDVMQALMQLPTNIDVELSGGSIFVYFRAGISALEDVYSVQALLTVGHLLIKELVDKGHAAQQFPESLKAAIARSYTVSQAHKASYFGLELLKYSILYWICLGWIFMLFAERASAGFVAGYGMFALFGFALLLIFLVRRMLRNRSGK